jgi:aminotransferase
MALEFALRALGVGGGDDVVIPAFCCTAIVRPIIATGAAPVFADVGVDLNLTAASVEAALTAKTRAVVVPHLFGQPADIRAIAELARGRNIRVVDDAAQALGASTAEKLAGAFGDAGVISFGAQKVCSGIGGGALIFSSGEAAARAQATRLRPASRALVLQLLLARIIAEQRWRSVLGRASFWFRHAPDTFPARYRHQSMANLQAAVARSLLESLPENLAARRVRVRLYRDVLGQDKRLELLPHAAGSACLVQIARVLPLRHGDDLAARVIALAGEAGYEVRGSYIPIHLLPGFQGHQRRRPAYAERIWGELVELPCGPEIGPGNIEHIAAIVQKAISF